MYPTLGPILTVNDPFPSHKLDTGSGAYPLHSWSRSDHNRFGSTYPDVCGRSEETWKPRTSSHNIPASSSHATSILPTNLGRTNSGEGMTSSGYNAQQYDSYTGRSNGQQNRLSTVPYTSSNAGSASLIPTASNVSVAVPDPVSHVHQIQSQSNTRPQSPMGDMSRRNLIIPDLQIPSSVNSSGGSLGEFAAQITCLFWFESTATLRTAEELSTSSSPVKRLTTDAIPTISFRKWVVTILSTTQVTKSVILLALLFIYRLKTLNPTVKGRAGSEYRLLTVALMLGNKFLDDNTYTNKTWAEVSGISVTEIHVMEVEFLSNMRYSLLASSEQWGEWQVKLGKFAEYIDQATKLPSPMVAVQIPVLPSPPRSLQQPTPPLSTYTPNSIPYNYNQPWNGQSSASSLPSMELIPGMAMRTNKRPYEDNEEEPPAKRMMRPIEGENSSDLSASHSRNALPRLPVPNLSVSTNQVLNNSHPIYPQTASLLPPIHGRAMSMVYPTTPGFAPHPAGTLTPTAPMSQPANQTLHGSQYGTPSRRSSPQSIQELISLHSSPISGNFTQNSQNSPSVFLQQRSSPYKPIRLPHTLLHPPPHSSMNAFPPSMEHMHYQPLGKRNDYRSGVVPDFVPHSSQQQHWQGLPQPNFYNN